MEAELGAQVTQLAAAGAPASGGMECGAVRALSYQALMTSSPGGAEMTLPGSGLLVAALQRPFRGP